MLFALVSAAFVAAAVWAWYSLWPLIAQPLVTCEDGRADPRPIPGAPWSPCRHTVFADWYTIARPGLELNPSSGFPGRPFRMTVRPPTPDLAELPFVGDTWEEGWLVDVERYFDAPISAYCFYSSDDMVACEIFDRSELGWAPEVTSDAGPARIGGL